MENQVNDALIDLRNPVNKKTIPVTEKADKIVDIAEKVADFNKQQKGKGLGILTPKQMLQRLPIAIPQVKAGNTSEKVLNEIRQIIYTLH